MRKIINFCITGLILWLASRWWPETVQIKNFGTLALATILISVISFLVVLVCFAVIVGGAAFESVGWILVGIGAIFFADIIALSILSSLLGGFAVVGFWPKVLLSICFSLLHLNKPSHDDYSSQF